MISQDRSGRPRLQRSSETAEVTRDYVGHDLRLRGVKMLSKQLGTRNTGSCSRALETVRVDYV